MNCISILDELNGTNLFCSLIYCAHISCALFCILNLNINLRIVDFEREGLIWLQVWTRIVLFVPGLNIRRICCTIEKGVWLFVQLMTTGNCQILNFLNLYHLKLGEPLSVTVEHLSVFLCIYIQLPFLNSGGYRCSGPNCARVYSTKGTLRRHIRFVILTPFKL